MLIDSHCHLNFKAFDKDLTDVVKRAKDAGIGKIIIPGAKLSSSEKAVKISRDYHECFAAIGIHPHHVNEYNKFGEKTVREKLNRLAGSTETVAIGEIGMDYFHYRDYPEIPPEDKKLQRELFILQLEIAVNSNLPVIIHCRQAQNDLLDILTSFIRNTKKSLSGVFHCFEGTNSFLSKVLTMGYFVGFDGNVTYEENIRLRDNIAFTPLDRLLLETDSPFLAPNPYRRTRNEPAHIVHTAKTVAQIKKIDINEVSKITSENAVSLFGLKTEV